MLVKQAERNALNCIVPAEKLFSLFSEHQPSSNESNETKSNEENSVILRRALDLYNDIQQFSMPKKHKHGRRKSKNHNENGNANVNENVNSNINTNTNRHHRRSFDVDPPLSKAHNQNRRR
ncbi:transcription factor mef2A-like isoform X2 [Temnothorax curvispinosus]|uniref:Transcription factor mef2A-like isoform X2 n=1 Tax=Temnothorax curvispinosus TaxID=300111 RepID=A0A6J1Q5D1_9HYME|nr:transcription factor mef2A-like isoform X2 [Temnothorax curvispinosus]